MSGATSYEWWLPYPYETVEQFDYFGENWQKLTNSADSSIQVFTGYAGTAGYVQVMAVNDCGIGGARIISVAHGGSDGAIPRLSNPVKVLNPKIYVNPANAVSNIKEKVDISNAEIMATLLLDTKIYPNPANGVLNIKVNEDVSNAKIMATLYDLLGRKILQVEVLDSIASLNVENIPAGNYILKLAYNSVVETHLIIIE